MIFRHTSFLFILLLILVSCNETKSSKELSEYEIYNQVLPQLEVRTVLTDYSKPISFNKFYDAPKAEITKKDSLILSLANRYGVDTSIYDYTQIRILAIGDSLFSYNGNLSKPIVRDSVNHPPFTVMVSNRFDVSKELQDKIQYIELSRVNFLEKDRAEFELSVSPFPGDGYGLKVGVVMKNGVWVVQSVEYTWIT